MEQTCYACDAPATGTCNRRHFVERARVPACDRHRDDGLDDAMMFPARCIASDCAARTARGSNWCPDHREEIEELKRRAIRRRDAMNAKSLLHVWGEGHLWGVLYRAALGERASTEELVATRHFGMDPLEVVGSWRAGERWAIVLGPVMHHGEGQRKTKLALRLEEVVW